MARVIEEFEASTEKRKCLDFRHHEEAKHVQKKFAQNFEDLAKAIEEMGNPFTENSNFLYWTVETLQIQPLLILFVKLRN